MHRFSHEIKNVPNPVPKPCPVSQRLNRLPPARQNSVLTGRSAGEKGAAEQLAAVLVGYRQHGQEESLMLEEVAVILCPCGIRQETCSFSLIGMKVQSEGRRQFQPDSLTTNRRPPPRSPEYKSLSS
jgi:hypothetical protein